MSLTNISVRVWKVVIFEILTLIRPFSKLRKLVNWQLPDHNRHINYYTEAQRQIFSWTILRYHLFLYKAQNSCTNKQLRMNKYIYLFIYFDMSQIFTPIWKVLSLGFDDCKSCLLQFANCQLSFGKGSIQCTYTWLIWPTLLVLFSYHVAMLEMSWLIYLF